ncbi:hypothetical protein [Trichocoleus sp. FACHB-90]|nr:hypothetical protein [Trichocoleus sp. FACHB-90]
MGSDKAIEKNKPIGRDNQWVCFWGIGDWGLGIGDWGKVLLTP